MSRYTPKRAPAAKGGGPARPVKAAKRAKPGAPAKKKTARAAKPGAFACPVCQRAFRTQEALATHALDAHDQPIDLGKFAPLSPGMIRCPECGAPVRKRNLEQHKRFIHASE